MMSRRANWLVMLRARLSLNISNVPGRRLRAMATSIDGISKHNRERVLLECECVYPKWDELSIVHASEEFSVSWAWLESWCRAAYPKRRVICSSQNEETRIQFVKMR